MPTRTIIAAAACGLFATPAFAEIPPDVQAMIDAAIATGDKAKVETVFDLAKQTQPDHAEEIEALAFDWRADQDEAKRLAEQHKQEEIRQAGMLDLWSGEGQVGAFLSTGNSEDAGLSVALNLTREGIDWTHALRASADYQRSNGVTSRERYLVAYEPRFEMGENLFAYGLAQYEHDKFQGFDHRYAVSGGFGYTLLDSDSATLSIKAGPAYRVTQRINGTSVDRIAGLFGMDFDWKLSDRITFTQDANAVAETGAEALLIVDSSNTTFNLLSGIDFKVSDRLRSRLSYQLEYNSNVQPDQSSTDTLTRFTLVYGF
jgi:putative salt-induced outer membrane protein|tara:strand:+ start:2191 stop:3138 length:948 start_codon:yes stop_codon:yes gene_type:complete